MTTENHIYDWLHNISHQIAEHAAPIRGADGDHSYDGAIEAVWDGIHEALGLDPDNFIDCMTASHDRHCEMLYSKQGNSLKYAGEPTTGVPTPPQHPDEAFHDGFDWAKIIDEANEENAMPNKTQRAILDMGINRGIPNPNLTRTILKAYREAQD